MRISVAKRSGLLAALVAALALVGCRSSSGGGSGSGGNQPPPPTPSRTYSATVTGVKVTRSADGLDMAVSGLPANGAVLIVP